MKVEMGFSSYFYKNKYFNLKNHEVKKEKIWLKQSLVQNICCFKKWVVPKTPLLPTNYVSTIPSNN